MTSRTAIIGASILCCLTALTCVFVQQRQLASLRASRQQSPDEAAATSVNTVETPAIPAGSSGEAATPAGELLQLRNQISRLTEQKRELSAVSAENEQLQTRAAAQRANAANPGAEMAVPPGYIRKGQAQWVGTGSPEQTLQSFLWAIENRNMDSLLQVVTPEIATSMKRQFDMDPNKFFDGAAALPGMRIVEQKQMPDGSVKVRVEIAPSISETPEITFQLIDGQWKMNMR